MHEVFVSYARVNNSLPGESQGWVSSFAGHLETQLREWLGSSQVGVFLDPQIQSQVDIQPAIVQRVRAASALVIVMSKGWLDSVRWCRQELYEFLKVRGLSSRRIWVIQIQPTDRNDWPSEIVGLKSADFYALDSDDKTPRRLGWPLPHTRTHLDFFNELNRLAWQIQGELKSQPAQLAETAPTVWLGDPADSVENDWLGLATAVQQANFLIAPKGPRSYSAIDSVLFEKELASDLGASLLRVQLLGRTPSRLSSWSNVPLDHLQKNRADLAPSNREWPVVRWRPPGLDPLKDVADEAHRALLSGAISCSLEELRDVVIARMRLLSGHQELPPAPAHPGRPGMRVGVAAFGAGSQVADQAESLLAKMGVAAERLPQQAAKESPSTYRNKLEQTLSAKDGVLIVQKAVPPIYVNSILSCSQKALAHRRLGQLWGGLLLDEQPHAAPSAREGLSVLESWKDGLEGSLHAFVQAMRKPPQVRHG